MPFRIRIILYTYKIKGQTNITFSSLEMKFFLRLNIQFIQKVNSRSDLYIQGKYNKISFGRSNIGIKIISAIWAIK